MKKQLNYILFLIGTSSCIAHATDVTALLKDPAKLWNQVSLEQAKEAPELRQVAQAIPQKLLQQGILKIGNVNIERLNEQIAKTTFRDNESFIATKSGSRRTAYYDPRIRTLVVNTSVSPRLVHGLMSAPESKLRKEKAEPILLHEAMGASGIDDRKYDKSLGSYILSRPNPNLKDEQKKELLQKMNQQLEKSGGSTTNVGGGGDELSLYIKLKLLERSLDLDPSWSAFLNILDMNIERNVNCDNSHVGFIPDRKEISYCDSFFWMDPNNEESQLQRVDEFVRELLNFLAVGRT